MEFGIWALTEHFGFAIMIMNPRPKLMRMHNFNLAEDFFILEKPTSNTFY